MQKIIVYLPPVLSAPLHWSCLHNDGTLQQSGIAPDITALTLTAADKDIILIASPADVLLVFAKLPKLPRQRLSQALPFALEEQLLSDVNDLHFAVGDYQPDGSYPVAVIAQKTVSDWLEIFKAAGLVPQSLLPAPLALPFDENSWTIHLAADQATVRTGLYSGFAAEQDNLATLIALQNLTAATSVELINTTEQPFLAEKVGLKNIVTEKRFTERQFFAAIHSSLTNPAINILQGDYQPKRHNPYSKKIWQLTASLLSAALSFVFVTQLVSYGLLQHTASAIDQKIYLIYHQHFPMATSVVAPKQRMTEKLNTAMNQHNSNRLLLWFAYLAEALKKTPAIHLQQADYREGRLTIAISAPTFQQVDQITQRLTEHGLTVKQQNIATVADQVKGSLIISNGNPS